jgi:hypothetical protein
MYRLLLLFKATPVTVAALCCCRDMLCEIHPDPQRGLMVTYLTREQKEQLEHQRMSATAAASSGSNQFIMNIDMAMWREMCRAVPRGQGLMLHRQPAVLPEAAAAAAAAGGGGGSRPRQRL